MRFSWNFRDKISFQEFGLIDIIFQTRKNIELLTMFGVGKYKFSFVPLNQDCLKQKINFFVCRNGQVLSVSPRSSWKWQGKYQMILGIPSNKLMKLNDM